MDIEAFGLNPYDRYTGETGAEAWNGSEAVSSVIQRAVEARRPAARYMANVPFAMKSLLSLGDGPKDLVL